MARRITKGIITAVDDTAAMQRVQVKTGPNPEDVTPDLDRFQSPGLSHTPQPSSGPHGAEAIFVETAPGLEAVVATDDRRARPTGGAGGDTVVYSTHDRQLRIELREDVLIVSVPVGVKIQLGSSEASDRVPAWEGLKPILAGSTDALLKILTLLSALKGALNGIAAGAGTALFESAGHVTCAEV